MSTAKKVALVTGAASGIGKATAIAFSEAGYRTVVSDVHEQGGQETVDLITHKGGEAFFAKADVSKEEDVASLMTSIKDKYGRLDAAFNNAGIDGEQAPISEYTLRAWQHVMDINLTGVFLCCKHEVPLMLEGGGGAIVNCASVLGKRGVANFPAYTASKHGVLGLTK